MSPVIAYLEDESAVRENFSEYFEDEGFDVIACASVAELESVDTRAVDLYVLDIGIDKQVNAGFDVCADILERSPSSRVIFLTMRNSPRDIERGLQLGAVAFLSKELPLSDIVETMKVNLDDGSRVR